VKTLVVVSSTHHGNTGKVATVMAGALGAKVLCPREVDREEIARYDLVGFGSGIDSGRHYEELLDLVDTLLPAKRKRAFIFSTCGAPVSVAGEEFPGKYAEKSHAALRGKLVSRGYTILGEFSCPGFNTNSFLKLIGGLNKGRPNAEDLRQAEEFARAMLRPHLSRAIDPHDSHAQRAGKRSR
jgi:flavodoxin